MAAPNSSNPVLLAIGTCNRRAGIVAALESFKKFHPNARALVCLVDRPSREMPPLDLPATVFFSDELSLPGGRRFLFKYDAFELCCALKPFAIAHVAHYYGVENLLYLDSDILVLNSFWADLESVWADHSVLLTPHLIDLPDDMPLDFQRSLVQHGAYNGGLVGLKIDAESKRFLDCWATLLADSCIFDPMSNLYVDQRWLDLLVACSSAVGVLRDPGLNVAYWNLHERRLSLAEGGYWRVNDRPLKFFHFSGFDRARLTTKAACNDELALRLARDYGQALDRAEDGEFRNYCYGWSHYRDGRTIAAAHRDLILSDYHELRNVADPFSLPEIIGWEKLEELAQSIEPVRASQRYLDWERSSPTLRRLRRHPVIGTVWRFWERFVNPSLGYNHPPS